MKTVSFFVKYKVILISVVAVIAIVLTIYFVGQKAGKRAADNPWQAPLPTDSENKGTSIDAARVRAVVDDLYTDLNYLDVLPMWGTRSMAVYQRWNAMSDTEFVAVYNDFNARFSSEFGGKSVRVILKNEWGWGQSGFNALRETIESRFERLKLV
jgi:hypothetical protein